MLENDRKCYRNRPDYPLLLLLKKRLPSWNRFQNAPKIVNHFSAATWNLYWTRRKIWPVRGSRQIWTLFVALWDIKDFFNNSILRKIEKKNNTEIRFSKYSIVNSICAFFSLIGNPLSLIDKLCSQIRNSFSRIKISSVDLNNLFSWIWIDTKVLVLQKFEWDVTNSKFGSHGD